MTSDRGDLEQRLAQIEQRLAELEDEREIRRLLATYGPAVDSGSAATVAGLWTEEGSYDYDADAPSLEGRAAIEAMVTGPQHQGLIADGCAHIVSSPLIRIDGDRATALGYHVLGHATGGGGFELFRLSVSRWDMARTPEGWKTVTRTHRLLDGRADGPDTLRAGLTELL